MDWLVLIFVLTAGWGIVKTWRFFNRNVTKFLFWLRRNRLEHVDNVIEHNLHITGRSVATFIVAMLIAGCTMPWLLHKAFWLEMAALAFWAGCVWHTISDFSAWISPEPRPTPPTTPTTPAQ